VRSFAGVLVTDLLGLGLFPETARSHTIAFRLKNQSLPDILPEIAGEGVVVHPKNGFDSIVTICRPDEPTEAQVFHHTGQAGGTSRERACLRARLGMFPADRQAQRSP
jgi:hypothetical protein